MLRVWIVAAGLLACACAPAPSPMAASDASERLTRFASGAPTNELCTPEGRALLRGAVRAYGAELARAGVAWPALPARDGEAMPGMDAAVVIAFAAGFVEASDFQSATRGALNRVVSAQWPQIAHISAAAQVACGQMLEVQRAAGQLVAEMDRFERISAVRRQPNPERVRRQRERLERAQAQLNALAAAVETQIAEARRRA